MDEPHWRLVPLPLRRTIVLLLNHPKDPIPGYAEACANAIEQVRERLRGRRVG